MDLVFTLYAYINEPTAKEVEASIPEISSKANNPPIKPPFNLSKFDFIRRIRRIKIVAFKEVILKKTKGAKGFNNIYLLNNYYFKNKIQKLLKLFKKKDSNEPFESGF